MIPTDSTHNLRAGAASLQRFVGLDFIRFISFIAICIFHITYVHYYTPDIAIARELGLFKVMEVFTRSLAFSGFTIAFLTSLLTAFSGKGLAKRARLFAFLLVGWLIFSALMESGETILVWDIYPLIFLGILIATLVEIKSPAASLALGVCGFAALWIPFWTLGEFIAIPRLPLELEVVLGFGNCLKDQMEWAILPWIGLIWFGYGCGQSLREGLGKPEKPSPFRLTLKEAAVWVVFFALAAPFWGGFYNINLGKFFTCEAYRQPPHVWWAHMVIPLFFIRLSIEPWTAEWLKKLKPLRWISNLAISRKFWLAYMLSYGLAHLTSFLGTLSGLEQTQWRVPATAIFCFGYFLSIELTTRLVLKISQSLLSK